MFRQKNYHADLKVILVGDERSGKTCLLKRLTGDKFSETHSPTLYDEFEAKCSVNFGKREYKLSLVELGGSKEFVTYRQSCYEEGEVILVCFSVVRPYDILNIGSTWLPEIEKYNPNAYILLVGTQTDLRSDIHIVRELERTGLKEVTYENGCELVELMKPYKVCGYVECSALNRIGVSHVFEEAVRLTEPETRPISYYPSILNLSFYKMKKTPRLFTFLEKHRIHFRGFRSRKKMNFL